MIKNIINVRRFIQKIIYIDSDYPNNNYASDWTLKTDRTIYSWDNSDAKILKFNMENGNKVSTK